MKLAIIVAPAMIGYWGVLVDQEGTVQKAYWRPSKMTAYLRAHKEQKRRKSEA